MTAPVMERIRKPFVVETEQHADVKSPFGCKAPSSYCYPLLREGYPVVAIENCRYVHFSVIALYFGNVGK